MPPIPAARRQSIIATYNAARADGKGVEESAKLAGATPSTISRWIEEAADDALADDFPRPVAKVRRCLRCGRPFKSSGPGNRICDRPSCRRDHVHEGLPADWATATVCVAD